MKHQFLILVITTLGVQAIGQDTIINRGFEHWTSHINYETPEGWQSDNQSLTTIPGNTNYPVVKSPDAFSGNYAVKMENLYYNFIGQVVPGVITNGQFSLTPTFTPQFSGGQAFNARPSKISGKYLYRPAGDDTCAVVGILTRFDMVNMVKDTIAIGTFVDHDTTASYQYFELNFTYLSPLIPDTLLMILTSSLKQHPPSGSVMQVDDMEAETSTGSIPLLPKKLVRVYPTVTGYDIYIRGIDHGVISIYNLLGNKVKEVEFNDNSIQLGSLSLGIYVYVISRENGEIVKKGKFIHTAD